MQQIERLNKRHNEAASESEPSAKKRKRQATTPSENEEPLRYFFPRVLSPAAQITDSYQSFIYNYNAIIKILVGQEKTPFSIHKENLCRSSTFFNAVFSNERYLDSREAQDGFLPPLSDVDPGLFRVYVHMVYTNELLSPLYFGFESYPEPKLEFKMYCELYFLVDRLGDHLASTIVLENLINNLEEWPKIHCTRIAKIWLGRIVNRR